MAKGSKPKMKQWRKEARVHNLAAALEGDSSGHKGRRFKNDSMYLMPQPSLLVAKMMHNVGLIKVTVEAPNEAE